jgi:hypothetical protein
MHCTSQSMRKYYKKNQIWRRRVPIDRLEYWDQCRLTDPYRLLLAISAIGKDIFVLPWMNFKRAEISIDDKGDIIGNVFIFDTKWRKGKYIKSTDIIATTYRVLKMKCTTIIFIRVKLSHIVLTVPQFIPIN